MLRPSSLRTWLLLLLWTLCVPLTECDESSLADALKSAAAAEPARSRQPRARSPHEVMARKKRLKTNEQLRAEAATKTREKEAMKAIEEEEELERRWEAREGETRGHGSPAADAARDRLIREMVVVLNATVRHEAGLATEVADLRRSEVSAEKALEAVAEEQHAEAEELAYVELALAAALAAALVAAATLRRRARGLLDSGAS